MQFQFTKCILLLSLSYTLYSLYGVYTIIRPQKCTKSCVDSLLIKNPKLTFRIQINDKMHILDIQDYTKNTKKQISVRPPTNLNDSLTATIIFEMNNKLINHQTYDLTFYQNKKKNLLSNMTTETISHWKGVLYLHLLEPFPLDPHALPQNLYGRIRRADVDHYLPVMYLNELKFVNDDGQPLNGSVLELNVDYSPMSVGMFMFHMEMISTIESLKIYGVKEAAFDELKSLINANIYLLFATFVVSSLHLILDMLAIKSEVDFWRKTESSEGISVSAVRWRFVSSIVIFFYLLDQKSSLFILLPLCAGIILEFWKVLRSSHASLNFSWPFIQFAQPSEAELESWNVEMQCVRLMSPLIYPVLGCVAVYTLLYVPQKSWYSWTLSTLANGVYSFGFVFMLPQLYINHKLKSVDKLPWQALIYKGVNAFIDDLFVFVVRMPTAHRLARFRDDIVFIVYIIQRFMYPVDRSRTHAKVE